MTSETPHAQPSAHSSPTSGRPSGLVIAYAVVAVIAALLTVWVYVAQLEFGVWDLEAHALLSIVWAIGLLVQLPAWWVSPGRRVLGFADTLLRWVTAGIGAFLLTALLASAGWREYGSGSPDWAAVLGESSEALALTPWFHALLLSLLLRWNLPTVADETA